MNLVVYLKNQYILNPAPVKLIEEHFRQKDLLKQQAIRQSLVFNPACMVRAEQEEEEEGEEEAEDS